MSETRSPLDPLEVIMAHIVTPATVAAFFAAPEEENFGIFIDAAGTVIVPTNDPDGDLRFDTVQNARAYITRWLARR